jgi:hypothetical protein
MLRFYVTTGNIILALKGLHKITRGVAPGCTIKPFQGGNPKKVTCVK